ncbi:MAG TPA: hypothetical protein VGL58_08490 [Caulobacteraceae bacterium]
MAALMALTVCSPAFAETLTDDSVVAMVKAGLGPDTVVAKIHTTATSFDVSTDKLVELKQEGVPDAVIAAMLNAAPGSAVSPNAVMDSTSADPNTPHASGIYLLRDDQTPPLMQHIDTTVSNQTATSGVLAYAFTYGIAKVKVKTVLPNPTARVKTPDVRPTFYFYFDQPNASLSGNQYAGAWTPGAVTSPNEFSLVRFEVDGGNREAVLGQFNITGMKTGVMDNARVAFSYDDVTPGVFKVTPSVDLPPGEYGFVYSITSGGGAMGAGQTAKIFDFAVVKQVLPAS